MYVQLLFHWFRWSLSEMTKTWCEKLEIHYFCANNNFTSDWLNIETDSGVDENKNKSNQWIFFGELDWFQTSHMSIWKDRLNSNCYFGNKNEKSRKCAFDTSKCVWFYRSLTISKSDSKTGRLGLFDLSMCKKATNQHSDVVSLKLLHPAARL